MFSSRLVPSERIYEQFFSIEDTRQGPKIVSAYPEKYSNDIAQKILQFVFPCKHRSPNTEEYTMIFTNSSAQLEFLACRYMSKPISLCLCIYSRQPWYEILHYILDVISRENLHQRQFKEHLRSYLKHIQVLPLTSPGNCLYLPTPDRKESRKFMVPSTTHPQFYSKYLFEFYNALDKDIWIDIFTSLLLERRIIFHSSRLQALSASILSAISLLYPLDWVQLVYPILPVIASTVAACPAPFIAGVHSCLIKSLLPDLCDDTRVVDLDNSRTYVTGPYQEGSDLLPKCLANFLRQKIKECNYSEKTNPKSHRTMILGLENYIRRISQIFLQGLVAILGGYHDALVADRSGQSKLDKDLFVNSRGPEMRLFLEELYHSQMIQNFLTSRVDAINSGLPIQDAFEDALLQFDPRSFRNTSRTQNLFCSMQKSSRKLTWHSKEKIHRLSKQSRSMSLDNLRGNSEKRISLLTPTVLSSNSTDLVGAYDIEFDSPSRPFKGNWKLTDDPDLRQHFPSNFGSLPAESKNMILDANANLSSTRSLARNVNISQPIRSAPGQPAPQTSLPRSSRNAEQNKNPTSRHNPSDSSRKVTSSGTVNGDLNKVTHNVPYPSLNPRNHSALKIVNPASIESKNCARPHSLTSSSHSTYSQPIESRQTTPVSTLRSQYPLPSPPDISSLPVSPTSISFTPRLKDSHLIQTHHNPTVSSSSHSSNQNGADSPTLSENSKSIRYLLEKWRTMENPNSVRETQTLPRNLVWNKPPHTTTDSCITTSDKKHFKNPAGIATEAIRKFELMSSYAPSEASTYANCLETASPISQSKLTLCSTNDDSPHSESSTITPDSTPPGYLFGMFRVPSSQHHRHDTGGEVEYNFSVSSIFRENGDFDHSETTADLYPTPAKRQSVDYCNGRDEEMNNHDYANIGDRIGTSQDQGAASVKI